MDCTIIVQDGGGIDFGNFSGVEVSMTRKSLSIEWCDG